MDRLEAERIINRLLEPSGIIVLPLDCEPTIINWGRRERRQQARHGTRGRRGARRVHPCPMYAVTVSGRASGEVLEAYEVPVIRTEPVVMRDV